MASAGSSWDAEYDVIVAGYGYSGAMAAIAAADAGSTVGLFEKMRWPGGNSVLSGGSCVFALDAGDALAYLRATCDGTTDDEVLKAFAIGLVELPELLTTMAADVGMATTQESRASVVYPFPGADTLHSLKVTRDDRHPPLDWVSGSRAGATLFRVVMEHVEQRRDAIVVHHDSPVRRLVVEDGEIAGCEIEIEGRTQSVRARQGVVLCTGGFEHDPRMISHFIGSAPITSIGPLGSTGDGIRMGQQVGGALWHMWHVHGSYGFRIPATPVAIRNSAAGPRRPEQAMPWIVVNRTGRRFMNEYPPAPQDTAIRDMLRFDADLQDYPNIPAWLIFDESGRKTRPLGRPAMTDPAIAYEWSEDNLAEIEKGWVLRSDTVGGLGKLIGADPAGLEETASSWNVMCETGGDPHLRPQSTMMPIAHPPFYAIEAHPVITNTQGGLVHDARQRVLDSFGEPIPRLYKAGENGSLFGHLYLLGGNNSECFIGGRTAGRAVASQTRRDVSG